MRKNTTQILLALYGKDQSTGEFQFYPYSYLYDMFPDISHGGMRSIVFHLIQQRAITRLKKGRTTYVQLTTLGVQLVNHYYPVLSQTKSRKSQSEAVLCILLNAPKHDKGFVQLRKILIDREFIRVNQGVYISERAISTDLHSILMREYHSSVSLCKIKEFLIGDYDTLLQPNFSSSHNLEHLSGIGKSIDQLIDKFNTKKVLNGEVKDHFFTIFQQMTEIFHNFSSTTRISVAESQACSSVMQKWNSLISMYYRI